MRFIALVIPLILLHCSTALSLEPNEILIIANSDNTTSVQIAEYYCKMRNVPTKNILAISLGTQLRDTISRNDYEKCFAEPIREKLFSLEFAGEIRCLLTTYGVPYKVGPRGPLEDSEDRLKELKELAEQKKETSEQLQHEIDRLSGKETSASVDSELSLVLLGAYELYRWQPNALRKNVLWRDFGTLMVCRLDGPDYTIVEGLVDKAIAAEKTGLTGVAYIDSRGLVSKDSYGYFDRSLRDLATLTRLRTAMPVKEERTKELFASGTCHRTAIYCGWYSLKNYVDAFDFVDGAVGYHISSFEAVNLRDPNSSQWCPAMLRDGITATLGAVDEPYLQAFPEPKAFFLELFNGACLAEAFYHTKPFNSWQLILIGDPLYRPFKKR
jgi:uncharacterized protein (TIGR03790 family)